MLLRFGKLHCLGDDLMVIDQLGQHVQIAPADVQRWASRSRGVGFRRLVVVGIPRDPGADFECRSLDRYGREIPSSFADLCCAVRFIHERRLSNQPELELQTQNGRVRLHVREDGWIAASYASSVRHDEQCLPAEVREYLQQLAARHQLDLSWCSDDRQLRVWSVQPAPQRLPRLLQPVARRLRGWQVLWLSPEQEQVRVQGWQGENEISGVDSAVLIAEMVGRHLQQQAVQVEWQQGCLLLEFFPSQERVQLFARATVVYEGRMRL